MPFLPFLNVAAAITPPEAPDHGILSESMLFSLKNNLLADTFAQAGPVVKCVLALLLLLSVICWGIVLFKYLMLRSARLNTEKFLDLFGGASSLVEVQHASQSISGSPLQEVFSAGYRELARLLSAQQGASSDELPSPTPKVLSAAGVENVERAMIKAKTRVATNTEKYLTFLATTGSTAPFIGLFGTVWGIMSAFRNIGATGNANLTTVAPGIAEALIATAVGLFAAIPAVVAYNFFLQRVRVLEKDMENFSTDLLNMIERQLHKK